MKTNSNVQLASKLYLDDIYGCDTVYGKDFEILPVKGYLTTNVYKLLINIESKNTIKYIKESSDLNNDKFNRYIEDEFNNTKYIFEAFNQLGKVSVVKPIVYFADHKLFFMDEIEGKRLDKVIINLVFFRKRQHLLRIINLCKNWLTEFQGINCQDYHALKKFDFYESEREKIKHLHMRSLENCEKENVDSINYVFNKAYDLVYNLKITQTDISYKHNDFAPWNILFDGKSITVYDFADVNVDFKYYDLMYFVHSLSKLTKKIPFSNGVFDIIRYEMLKDTGISQETENYYSIYFYLQDIAFLLAKIKQGGFRAVLYRYKSKKILNKVNAYLERI